MGRISLNPLVHIDLVGTVVMPLLQIFMSGIPLLAWAKPTPVDPRFFRDVRRGQIVVSGAGPVSNLLLALLFTAGLFVAARLVPGSGFETPVLRLLVAGIQLNVILALFNLVPLPPLDGSWIASWGLPRPIAAVYDRIVEPYGQWILLILFATGVLSLVTMPFINLILGFLSRLVF
jgi:Zn-dependent protease